MCCALQHMEAHAYLATAGSSFAAARITLDGESLSLRGTPTVALSGVEVSLPAGA